MGEATDDVLLGWVRARISPFRSAFGLTVLVTLVAPLVLWISVYVTLIVITVGQSLWDAFTY